MLKNAKFSISGLQTSIPTILKLLAFINLHIIVKGLFSVFVELLTGV